jgi:uncharacterized phosphosugar-binding protein
MGNSSSLLSAYSDQINLVLQTFQNTQGKALEAASKTIVEAYLAKKRFLVFGSGHSHMVAEEFYARAGGLAYVTPILQNELSLTDHPLKSTLVERTLEMAKVYFELYHMEKGDVLLIASNSGRNAMPIELARMAKEAGLTVIVFINDKQSKVISSRHPSGKNLAFYSDIIIDNCGAWGDAGFEVADGLMMGASSTLVGAYMAQSLSILVASKIKDLGLEVPVFRSSNLDGADQHNKELMDRFCKSY